MWCLRTCAGALGHVARAESGESVMAGNSESEGGEEMEVEVPAAVISLGMVDVMLAMPSESLRD